tara:strand:- start:212 stop:418 length:207 start_codon:yes stop_codon:yes gene_type:complete
MGGGNGEDYIRGTLAGGSPDLHRKMGYLKAAPSKLNKADDMTKIKNDSLGQSSKNVKNDGRADNTNCP